MLNVSLLDIKKATATTDEFGGGSMLKNLEGLEEIGKMKPPKISNINHFFNKSFVAGINAKGNAQYIWQCTLCAGRKARHSATIFLVEGVCGVD